MIYDAVCIGRHAHQRFGDGLERREGTMSIADAHAEVKVFTGIGTL